MGLLDSIGSAIKGNFDKKKEEREIHERIQKEAQMHKLTVFEDEMRKNVHVVATAQAKKEAAEMSGLQKLRATNRLRNLQSNEIPPGSFFDKLSEFSKKNKARTAENLKRTAELRATAEKMKQEKTAKNEHLRNGRTNTSSRTIGGSTWKM